MYKVRACPFYFHFRFDKMVSKKYVEFRGKLI